MHRASMAEMVVPYGDPTGGYFRRNAFDTGEYGVGQFLDSLALGCDCLGHIQYFDAWQHDWHGKPRRIANAICIHEEDFGILWKFSDFDRGTGDGQPLAAPGRVLHFDDRQLRLRLLLVLLSGRDDRRRSEGDGRPLVSGVAPEARSGYGALVAPGIDAHVHQHVFSFRFDMCSTANAIRYREVNFAAGPDGRRAIATAMPIAITETALNRESAGAAGHRYRGGALLAGDQSRQGCRMRLGEPSATSWCRA